LFTSANSAKNTMLNLEKKDYSKSIRFFRESN